jgi:hypothetical protein
MPRSPRVFLEGGVYHIYNRVTRGERVFGDDQEALILLDTIREVRDRDTGARSDDSDDLGRRIV